MQQERKKKGNLQENAITSLLSPYNYTSQFKSSRKTKIMSKNNNNNKTILAGWGTPNTSFFFSLLFQKYLSKVIIIFSYCLRYLFYRKKKIDGDFIYKYSKTLYFLNQKQWSQNNMHENTREL